MTDSLDKLLLTNEMLHVISVDDHFLDGVLFINK